MSIRGASTRAIDASAHAEHVFWRDIVAPPVARVVSARALGVSSHAHGALCPAWPPPAIGPRLDTRWPVHAPLAHEKASGRTTKPPQHPSAPPPSLGRPFLPPHCLAHNRCCKTTSPVPTPPPGLILQAARSDRQGRHTPPSARGCASNPSWGRRLSLRGLRDALPTSLAYLPPNPRTVARRHHCSRSSPPMPPHSALGPSNQQPPARPARSRSGRPWPRPLAGIFLERTHAYNASSVSEDEKADLVVEAPGPYPPLLPNAYKTDLVVEGVW